MSLRGAERRDELGRDVAIACYTGADLLPCDCRAALAMTCFF
jgi:hypothetical protein